VRTRTVQITANFVCVDLEINVTDITQTSATVSWSTGETEVDSTVVYYRVTGTTSWISVSAASQSTTRSISGLEPGTEYQFYVQLASYGETLTSDTVTITTGKRCTMAICTG